ncbi:MAG: hypothetical protein IPL86_10580 [Flavobacteriales bacterium]|nr:hypothetical protein [Flavobacteriales bacterium]
MPPRSSPSSCLKERPPGGDKDFFVDNFQVRTPPTCFAPTAVAVSGITQTDATVAWTCTSCTGDYIVEYGAPGFTPGNGATAGVGGTIWTGAPVGGSSVTLTGLSGSSSYSVYVREHCSGADYSFNSAVANFATLCSTVNVPYTQNFESAVIPAMPNCMSTQNLNAETTWITASSTYLGASSKVARYPYSSTTAANDWMYTPGINLVGGTPYTLSYTYGANGFDESLEVYYGTAASAASMTNLVVDHGTFSTAPFTVSYTITPATSGVYYIGWHAYSGANEFYLEVDNISLILAPACPPVSAVSVSGTTSATTNVNFTCSGCTGNKIVEYGPAGYTPGTGATAGATGTLVTSTGTSPQAITGLTPSTTYNVYVHQDCSGASNGYSTNSALVSFTTSAPPPANDNCAQAVALTVNPDYLCGAVTAGTVAAATLSVDAISPCGGNPNNDVWFSFVAASPIHRISLTGVTPFTDMYHAVYSGSCGTLTNLVCSDADISNPTGLIVGNTYYVRVYSYGNTAVTTTFNVCVGTAPALDMSATALVTPTTTGCYGAAEPVSITVKNNGSQPVNFATNNTTVTVNVTGVAPQVLSATLTTGTLAVGATQNVAVGTLNMTTVRLTRSMRTRR